MGSASKKKQKKKAAQKAKTSEKENLKVTTTPEELSQKPQENFKKNDLEKQLEEEKKSHLYLRAEFDNYRKQTIKERSEQMKYGHTRIASEFLNILDIFEQALSLEIGPNNWSSFYKGVQLTSTEIKNLLEKFGIRELECEKSPFDPNFHEAVGSEASSDIPPGHVLKVYKKAYMLHDKLLRPAQVIVAKEETLGTQEETTEEPEEPSKNSED